MSNIMRDNTNLVEPAALKESVSYRLRLLQIASYKSFEKQVTGFGIAPRYYGLLKLVQSNLGIHQMRLAEAVFLDRSSLVPILESLEKEGWVERRVTKQDKRIRCVFMTAPGENRLAKLDEEVKRSETELTAGFSASQMKRLLSDLDRLDTNLRRVLKPDSGEGKNELPKN